VGGPVVHQVEGRAEGEHLAHGVRRVARHLPGEDPPQAPADQADRLAVIVPEIGQPLGQLLQDPFGRAEVDAEAPAVGGVAELGEVGPQRPRRAVPGRKAGQYEHWVAVTMGAMRSAG